MKLEDLIKELEKIKEKYGNLEVYSAEEEQGNLIFDKYKFPPIVTILGNKSTCKKIVIINP